MNTQTWKLTDGSGENSCPENFAYRTMMDRKYKTSLRDSCTSPRASGLGQTPMSPRRILEETSSLHHRWIQRITIVNEALWVDDHVCCKQQAARHISLWHVDRRTSPCCLELRSTTFHRWSREITADPSPLDQHLRSRASTSPRPLRRHGWGRTPATRCETDLRTARKSRSQSKRSISTRYHQLRDAVKVVIGVIVELRQKNCLDAAPTTPTTHHNT
jgi:hypothetical protein